MGLKISESASKCSDLDIWKKWYQSDNIHKNIDKRIQGT